LARFILKGKAYLLDKGAIETKMSSVEPELIRQYYVEINKRRYPPKQVISMVLDLGRVEFTTMDAVNILRRLGFEIGRL
jgi:hypothetical protein